MGEFEQDLGTAREMAWPERVTVWPCWAFSFYQAGHHEIGMAATYVVGQSLFQKQVPNVEIRTALWLDWKGATNPYIFVSPFSPGKTTTIVGPLMSASLRGGPLDKIWAKRHCLLRGM